MPSRQQLARQLKVFYDGYSCQACSYACRSGSAARKHAAIHGSDPAAFILHPAPVQILSVVRGRVLYMEVRIDSGLTTANLMDSTKVNDADSITANEPDVLADVFVEAVKRHLDFEAIADEITRLVRQRLDTFATSDVRPSAPAPRTTLPAPRTILPTLRTTLPVSALRTTLPASASRTTLPASALVPTSDFVSASIKSLNALQTCPKPRARAVRNEQQLRVIGQYRHSDNCSIDLVPPPITI